jgi:hypothetical protein
MDSRQYGIGIFPLIDGIAGKRGGECMQRGTLAILQVVDEHRNGAGIQPTAQRTADRYITPQMDSNAFPHLICKELRGVLGIHHQHLHALGLPVPLSGRRLQRV